MSIVRHLCTRIRPAVYRHGLSSQVMDVYGRIT
jgi:hypothetical protein